jgi:putative addiction module component (TIGR02574 family)
LTSGGDRGYDELSESIRSIEIGNPFMSTITRQILEKALVLSAAERADLVESLLASLDQPDPRIDELWAKEAEHRLAAYEAGRMEAYPADEVFEEFKDL